MESITSLIKSVCIISGAICLVEILVSGTRFQNQIKFLLNLILITVILTPLVKGTYEFELPDIGEYNDNYSDSENIYNEELKRQTSENISAVLMEQITAAGINCSNIDTNVNISESEGIFISSVTVSSDDFQAAAEIIRNSLGADTEVLNGNTG
jgi:hypothetical protein